MAADDMFERFTDRARKVMALSNQEAQRFNHEYIGPEHLLLGLIKEGTGVGASVLRNLNIDLRKVRIEVEKVVKSGPDMVTMGKLPKTPTAKKILEKAIEAAVELKHNYVGTEHILLGLIDVTENNIAHTVLKNLGVEPQKARSAVMELLGTSEKSENKKEDGGWKGPITIQKVGSTSSGTTFSAFIGRHVESPARRTIRATRAGEGMEELFSRGYYLKPAGECKVEDKDGAVSAQSYELLKVDVEGAIQIYVGSLDFAIRESLRITEDNVEQ